MVRISTPLVTPGARHRRGLRVGALAVLCGLVATGCGVQPGAAAVVDGREISQARLESTRADLASFVPEADAGAVLVAMIVAPLFIDAAAEAGVGVSPEQARAAIEETALAAGATPQDTYSDGVLEVIQFTLAIQALQDTQAVPDGAEILTEVDQAVQDLDIEVNPRYGEFDAAAGTITATALPWIVQPTE